MAGNLSCIEIQTKYHKNDLNCFEYAMVIDATWAAQPCLISSEKQFCGKQCLPDATLK